MIARAALVWTMLVACSDPAVHVQFAPIDFAANCGRPPTADVTAVDVIAYTSHGESRNPQAEINNLTSDTLQLGVEVLGGGSTVLATGKSAPLAYNDLPDGTEIPIAMLPPDGFCAVGPMTTARAQPLIARAGSGVLVFGGDGANTAEYFDPTTATFTAIALPGVLTPDSLVGSSIATLPDGRAVVSGGQILIVFDPATMSFSLPSVVEPRSEHVSYGIDASHLLVTGGCFLQGTTCDIDGSPRPISLVYELDPNGAVVGEPTQAASLPTTKRYNGQLFDIGIVSDDTHRLVLADATPDLTSADRIGADGLAAGSTVANMHSQTVVLDGGALLTTELDGAPTSPPTEVLAPDGTMPPSPIALAPSVDGARMALAEDGSVVAIGGDPQIAHYNPTTNAWTQEVPAGAAPGPVQVPSLIRLDDGSILVLGGTIAGAATADAWLYRPSLVGPTSGQVNAVVDRSGAVLTPTDPSKAAWPTGGGVMLTATDDDLAARVLVGGPRLTTGTMQLSSVVQAGGLELIAQQTGPARALVARLVPGEVARIERHDGATVTPLCTGSMVMAADLAQPISLVVASDAVSATAGNTLEVRCDFSHDPISPERGQWGVAVTGTATVETVSLAP